MVLRDALALQNDDDARSATVDRHRQTEDSPIPVLQVWDGVLALPIVGSIDTARAQEMSEALLDRIVAMGADVVLLDITGVQIMDTAVAKHLLEMVMAARLLGAEVVV